MKNGQNPFSMNRFLEQNGQVKMVRRGAGQARCRTGAGARQVCCRCATPAATTGLRLAFKYSPPRCQVVQLNLRRVTWRQFSGSKLHALSAVGRTCNAPVLRLHLSCTALALHRACACTCTCPEPRIPCTAPALQHTRSAPRLPCTAPAPALVLHDLLGLLDALPALTALPDLSELPG